MADGQFLLLQPPVFYPSVLPHAGSFLISGRDVAAHGDPWTGEGEGKRLVADWWSKWQRNVRGAGFDNLGNGTLVADDTSLKIEHAGSTECSGPGDDFSIWYHRFFVFDSPRTLKLTIKIRSGYWGGSITSLPYYRDRLVARLWNIDKFGREGPYWGYAVFWGMVAVEHLRVSSVYDNQKDACEMQEVSDSDIFNFAAGTRYCLEVRMNCRDQVAGDDTGYHLVTFEETEEAGDDVGGGNGFVLGEYDDIDNWNDDDEPDDDGPDPGEDFPNLLWRLRYWWPAHTECGGSITSFSTARPCWLRLNAHPDAPAKRYVAKITIVGDRNKNIPQPGEGSGWITHKVFVATAEVATVIYENGTMGPGCPLSKGTDSCETTTPGLYAIVLESKSNMSPPGAWFNAGFVDYIVEIYEETV